MHIQVTIISRLKAALSEAKGKERWREQETSLLPPWAGPMACPEQSGQKTLRGKKTHLAGKCETVPERSWPSGGSVINSERLLRHQTIWRRGESSVWCSFQLDLPCAPRGISHLNCHHARSKMFGGEGGRGKRGICEILGFNSFSCSPFPVQPLTNEGGYEGWYWGGWGCVIHMKASFEWKIKEVN